MNPYTVEATPQGEARVARDLARITGAVREVAAADALLAVYLLGGYARGEGTVVCDADGEIHGFNDYDLLLVFASPPADPRAYDALGGELARELGIDFVDLGLATTGQIRAAPPTLFWYELGEAHRLLWPEDSPVVLPRFRPEELDPAEGSRLLFNRGMALLWAALRLWREGGPGEGNPVTDSDELRFCVIAAHKAVLAAGDAELLSAGAYRVSQEARLKVLRARDSAELTEGFLEDYGRAVRYRRRPDAPGPQETARLWLRARELHEVGFRRAEQRRLGGSWDGWAEYEQRLAAADARLPWRRPREVLRRARSSLRRRDRLAPESRAFLGMTGLLYRAPGGECSSAQWRDRSERVIRVWHPA